MPIKMSKKSIKKPGIAKLLLILIILCVITYLIGMLMKKKYREKDAILLVFILIFTMITNPVVSIVSDMRVRGVLVAIPVLIMLIINILMFAGKM